MNTYETTNARSERELRQRVKKVQARARAAGRWYMFGTFALAVFAFLPLITIGDTALGITTFVEPFKTLGGEMDLVGVITSALYVIILLVLLINFIRCCTFNRRLTKNREYEVNNYNRNQRAMEKIGKIYSRAFGTAVCLYLLIAVLQSKDVTVEVLGFGAVAFGILIHFIAGLSESKVSCFDVLGKTGRVIEETRTGGVLVYFFRNLVQLTDVIAILFFFTANSKIGTFIGNIFGDAGFQMDLVAILNLVTLIFLFGMIAHATSSKEFNYQGIYGKGMKTFAVFSCFTFVASAGALVMQIVETGMPKQFDLIYIPVIALVGFLVDCGFQAKRQKLTKEQEEQRYVEENKPLNEPAQSYLWPYNGQQFMQDGMQIPQMPPIPQQMVGNGQQQPIYIPVYYPCVVPSEQQQPAPKAQEPAPAPVEVPAPVPAPPVDKSLLPPEIITETDPDKTFRVRCPQCGKELGVKDRSPYHRCSACGKVFTLQKFRTYKKA